MGPVVTVGLMPSMPATRRPSSVCAAVGEEDRGADDTSSAPWTYDVTVPLVHNGQGWKLDWSPAVVLPQLNATNRLVHTHTTAQRGAIIGANNQALVEQFTVAKVGIDKTRVSGTAAVASARALAGVVGIDPDKYATQVANSSDKAFVLAITLRQG